MKKLYLLLFFLCFVSFLQAQTTETFEGEPHYATNFNDNGQAFNITTQAGGGYTVVTYAYGWNGSSHDQNYVSNDDTWNNTSSQFTVSTANGAPFTLKSMYMALWDYNYAGAPLGSLTITGKLAGNTVFTATYSGVFTYDSSGYSFFNMETFGGQNNSNTSIDSFVISSPSTYIYFDTMRWQSLAGPSITSNPSNKVLCAGSNTTFAVTATGATSYQWQVNTGSGFANIENGGVYSGATTSTLTITGATAGMNGYQYRAVAIGIGSTTSTAGTLTVPTITGSTVVTNVACLGGSNGAINLTPSGGTSPYTFNWGGGITTEDRTGLTAGTYSVTITDVNGCTGTVSGIAVSQPAMAGDPSVFGNNLWNVYAWNSGFDSGAAWAANYAGYYTDSNLNLNTESAWDVSASPSEATGYQGCPVAVDQHSWSAKRQGFPCGYYSLSVLGVDDAVELWVNGTMVWQQGSCCGGPYYNVWQGYLSSSSTIEFRGKEVNSPSYGNLVLTLEPPIIVPSQTNASCNGGANGSASVNVSGGTGTYTYVWNTTPVQTTATASGLAAGSYNVIITSAGGCSSTQSFTITQPSALVASAVSQTNIACNGGTTGSATVAATGGTPGYTYSWSPAGGTAATATGLSAGTYTVTVTDANACTATQSFTITQPASAVSGTTVVTNVSCNGGSNGAINLTPTGGTGPYTFLWNGGATTEDMTGLVAGSYSVTITDVNGCTGTVSGIIVTQPSAIVASTIVTNIACNGGTTGAINLTPAGGAGPYTFNWGGGITTEDRTGLTAGSYSVTITDINGCTGTVNATVTQPSALVASPVVQTNIACNGGSDGSATVAVTGGTGAYTYSWAPMGGTATTATGLSAGTYTVMVTDANGCTATQSFTITQPAALVASASSQTNVSCNGGANGSATVAVTGGTGAYTYSWAPMGGTAATASGLAAGTYTVTVTDANGCTATQSFTITQPAALVASASSQTNVSCNGGSNGSATVAVTGGTGAYTYSWSPSGGTAATASGLAAGTYTVTVTDANGCTATQSFTITQPAALVATLTSGNATCPGAADGTATVTVTGGTGAYTYSWSPSGGTAATATGLTAGTYTVTVTDANGCTVTESIEVLTTPDVTAPVADIANLPAITNYCSVLAAEIAIPTATDNCNGTITATTTDALEYTSEGSYTITWSYDDGNGNSTTQTQTINVLASPLDQVAFNDATLVYNTNVQTIEVENLPAGATVDYTTTPVTGTDNGAVNAGIYTVTAIVTPPAEAFNCDPITLTATLTIDRAPQVIAFDPIPVKNLENDPDFQLNATATSGLPVYYTYTFTAPQPPATVSAEGFVDMLTSGEVLITAHQDGNENYLPAESVTQLLVIESSNAFISAITVGGQAYDNPSGEIYHLIECADSSESVDVTIVTEVNATVVPGHQFTIETPAPGIYSQEVTVTSQDGTVTNTYTVVVEKRFNFFDIVEQKFDNVLLVNNNPATNGGYEFVAYQWYRNNQLIGTGQYYSAGEDITDLLNPDADYYVRMTTVDGEVLQTCVAQIELEHDFAARLYPNPAVAGRFITIDANFPQQELDQMQLSLYSLTGSLVTTVKSSSRATEIQLPAAIEDGTYIVVIETPNINRTLKVIVRK